MKPLHLFFSLLALVAPLQTNAGEITISAAASLTNAFTDIKAAFEKDHNITVNTNFAASNPLLQQIREGAPADIFASADQETMDRAQADKLIDPATRRDFVSNSLVLIVAAGNNSPVKSSADLAQAARIAMGNPDSVPAGRYARDSLQSSGQWDELADKYIPGETVRQVLDYVSRGEADAGFVYATDAFIAGDSVNIVQTMDGHAPILYPIAVVSASSNKADAQVLIDYIMSPDGMAVLKAYGFSPVE